MRWKIRPTMVLDILELAILAGGIISLSAISLVNVISREAGHSIVWAEELSQLIMFLITFFGISYGARKARHIRMGAIFDLVNERVKKVMMFTIASGTALLMFYLAYLAIGYALYIEQSGRVTVALRWPYWTFVIWPVAGFILTGIQYSRTIIKNVREKEVWMSPEEKTEYS